MSVYERLSGSEQSTMIYLPPNDSLELAQDLTRRICIFDSRVIMSENYQNMSKKQSIWYVEAKGDSSAAHYRNKRNAKKPGADELWGKYGEFAACVFFSLKGFPKVLPDTTVYDDIKDKIYEADMPFGQIDQRFPDCGVKTCTDSTLDFMESWTQERQMTWVFQLNDVDKRNGRDRLFQETESSEPILFMYVDRYTWESKLVASAPWSRIHSMLKDPISPKLKGLKKCLYFDDLVAANNDQT